MPAWRSRTGAADLKQDESGRACGAQELHELITDLGRGFVLYPVAHIVEFERPDEPGKAGAHLVHRQWIELFQAIRLSPNEKGRLRDLRAFESGGQIEIRFCSAVIVQAAVKAGALEFRNVMTDVIWLRPCRQWPGDRTIKASRGMDRTPPLIGWSGARSPIQNPWNGDGGVSPNLIGVRSDLFKHVEVVLMTRLPHPLEDADVPTRNVRHTQAEQSFKSIRTHQRRIPRVTGAPVMPHEDRAGDLQRIEQTNEVAGRLQRRVHDCVQRSCAA